MALIRCKKCNKLLRLGTSSCPFCGLAVRHQSPLGYALLIVVLLSSVAWVSFKVNGVNIEILTSARLLKQLF